MKDTKGIELAPLDSKVLSSGRIFHSTLYQVERSDPGSVVEFLILVLKTGMIY